MNFAFWIIIGLTCAVSSFIAYTIIKSAGYGEYITAYQKCKNCKYFHQGLPKYREIDCQYQGPIAAEFAEECNKFISKWEKK